MTDSLFLSILRLLQASPTRTQRELAQELGMSLGKANYLLRQLLGKGFVKVRNFRNSTNKGVATVLRPVVSARCTSQIITGIDTMHCGRIEERA